MKTIWTINCIKNCPTIEARALPEKKDLGGNYFPSFETGAVMFIVIKIGKVTNKSS